MDELKNQLAQYLCSQIHNGTKDLIELIESTELYKVLLPNISIGDVQFAKIYYYG